MKDRIKEFMELKGISAGDLAIALEVQRSNISHILNGRNKPGASFIQKLLSVFPDLNARWLLTGEGDMVESTIKDLPIDVETDVKPDLFTSITTNKNANAEIDKIVLLYKDGTFGIYLNK